MTTLLQPQHPFWYVRDFALSNAALIRTLHLSYYRYIPQTIADARTEISLAVSEFASPDRIEQVIDSLPEGHELAFHSTVDLNDGETAHIPLIDMSTGSAAQLEKLRPFLGQNLFSAFKWYRSGRSFHGYGATFVSPREWAALMGVLLLANQKGFAPTVDPRWIGHRLMAGYSALRWTKNTEHYIEVPRAVATRRQSPPNAA